MQFAVAAAPVVDLPHKLFLFDWNHEGQPTDTAGYTEIVFALFHLLGLQFAPRIRDLGAQRLYRLDAPPRKEGVAVLLKGLVRSKTLLDNWDELLRVAGSLKLGWVTASLLISKLQAGARENVLSRASAISGASSRPSSS